MPPFDRALAIIVLGATFGPVALRAYRLWADFRLQRRYVDVLVRSVTELERPTQEHRA